METHRCQFCDHDNSADAKYCSNCGGCLYLVPCPSCGAINDIKAAACHQCRQSLNGGAHDSVVMDVAPVAVINQARGSDLMSRALETGKLEVAYPAPPASEMAAPPARRRNPVILGAVVALAVVAGLGYYAYRHHGVINLPAPTSAGGAAPESGLPVGSGVIRAEAAAGGAAAAGTTASTAAEACGGEASTLGLCAPQSAGKKASEAAASTVPGAGEAAGSQQSQACGAASVALGLCTPAADSATTVPTVTHTRRSE